MTQKIDKLMLRVTTMGIPLILIIFSLWLWFPRTPLEVHQYEVYNDISPQQNRTMKTFEVKAGEEIEFDISFTKSMDVTCEVTVLLKQVDNGYLFPYEIVPRYITRMPVGSHHYKNSTLVPRATPEGKYIFIRSYSCEINPLNTFKTSIKSNEFFVKGKVPSQLEAIMEGNETSKVNTKKLDTIIRKDAERFR